MNKIFLFYLLFYFLFSTKAPSQKCPEIISTWNISSIEENIKDFSLSIPFFYAISEKYIYILDFSNRKDLQLISMKQISFKPKRIYNFKENIFVLDEENFLHIFYFSNNFEIIEKLNLKLEESLIDIFFHNSFVFILFKGNLSIYDLSNFQKIKKLTFEEEAISGIFSHPYFYLLKNSKVSILNLEDLFFPYTTSNFSLEEQFSSLALSDSYLYLINGNAYIVLDISNKNEPKFLFKKEGFENIKRGKIQGSYLILNSEKDFLIFEISNPKNPESILNLQVEKIFNLKNIDNFIIINSLKELTVFDFSNCCNQKPESFVIEKPIQETKEDGTIEVIFDFSDSKSAIYYEIYLDQKNPPQDKVEEKFSQSKAYLYLKEKGIYYFQIKAINGCGEFLSEIGSFNLAAPEPFELILPEDQVTISPLNVFFDWSDSNGAQYYELYLGITIPPPLFQSYIYESNYTVPTLQENTIYYWFVKAINSDGSANSRKRSFETLGLELKMTDSLLEDNCSFSFLGSKNKIAEPGEDINLWIKVKNNGYGVASNLYAVLESLNPLINVYNDLIFFPDIPEGQESYSINAFLFNVSQDMECISQADFKLTLYCQDKFWEEYFSIPIGKLNYKIIFENFESWNLENWYIKNNGGNCVWESNNKTGLPNYTGGEGFCAVADSDWCGEATTMDTELWTPSFSIPYSSYATLCQPYGSFPPYATIATLSFKASYKDAESSFGDDFSVDISKDDGFSWENLLFWNESHSPLGPGEIIYIDLTPFSGVTNAIIRFVYKALDWFWWAEVDDVEVNLPYVCSKCGESPQNFNLIEPLNGQTGVPLQNVKLKFTSSQGAECYNIYFGDTNPPPLFESHINYTEVILPNLLPSTWYYWKVEAVNRFGITNSQDGIFSFRTISNQSPKAIPEGSLKALKNGNMLKLLWEESCGVAEDYTIYEGNLDVLISNGTYNHYSIVCNDVGKDLQEEFYPSNENSYYLVVPRNLDGIEGSYGRGRPQGQDLAGCGITGFEPIECETSIPKNGKFIGYYKQTNNGDWEGYINSPLNITADNGYIIAINEDSYGIVYIVPQNYVIMLGYGGQLAEPIPYTEGTPFQISFEETYIDSTGNIVLKANFSYDLIYLSNHFMGTLVLVVTALDPVYDIYAGTFYFNFDSGYEQQSTTGGIFLGYDMQTNNGGWEGYINSPLNFTVENSAITWWDEQDKGLVYITPSNYVILLGYRTQFDPPIPIEDGQPFSILFSKEYFDDLGNMVLTADFVIDGVPNGDYFIGSINSIVKALHPNYNIYQGNWYFNFESGIFSSTVSKEKKGKDFKILNAPKGLKIKKQLKTK